MKVRIGTFFLGIVVLWGSLVAYSHQIHSSDIEQSVATTADLGVALAPKVSVAEQEPTPDFPLAISTSITLAKTHTLHQKIHHTSPSTHKPIKAYLIRVFRN